MTSYHFKRRQSAQWRPCRSKPAVRDQRRCFDNRDWPRLTNDTAPTTHNTLLTPQYIFTARNNSLCASLLYVCRCVFDHSNQVYFRCAGHGDAGARVLALPNPCYFLAGADCVSYKKSVFPCQSLSALLCHAWLECCEPAARSLLLI